MALQMNYTCIELEEHLIVVAHLEQHHLVSILVKQSLMIVRIHHHFSDNLATVVERSKNRVLVGYILFSRFIVLYTETANFATPRYRSLCFFIDDELRHPQEDRAAHAPSRAQEDPIAGPARASE